LEGNGFGKWKVKYSLVQSLSWNTLEKQDTATYNNNFWNTTACTNNHDNDHDHNATMITSDFGTPLLPRDNGSWILDDERWFKCY
jgi:hypothetical protein